MEEACDKGELSLEQREFTRRQAGMTKDGFRAGLSAGQEVTLQEGFNLGYGQGLTSTLPLSRLRGMLTAALCQTHICKRGKTDAADEGHVTWSEDLVSQVESAIEELVTLEKKLECGEGVGGGEEEKLGCGAEVVSLDCDVGVECENPEFREIKVKAKQLLIQCGLGGNI